MKNLMCKNGFMCFLVYVWQHKKHGLKENYLWSTKNSIKSMTYFLEVVVN